MDDYALPSLHAIFDGARSFGLTDAEAWRTLDQCLADAGEQATLYECLDQLIDAFAREILAKQRGEPRPGHASGADPGRADPRLDRGSP